MYEKSLLSRAQLFETPFSNHASSFSSMTTRPSRSNVRSRDSFKSKYTFVLLCLSSLFLSTKKRCNRFHCTIRCRNDDIWDDEKKTTTKKKKTTTTTKPHCSPAKEWRSEGSLLSAKATTSSTITRYPPRERTTRLRL